MVTTTDNKLKQFHYALWYALAGSHSIANEAELKMLGTRPQLCALASYQHSLLPMGRDHDVDNAEPCIQFYPRPLSPFSLLMRATLSLETNLIRKGGRDHYHHARLLSGQHLLPLRRRLLVTKTEGDTLKDALETVSHSNMEKRVVANRLGVPLEPTWSIKAFLSESSPSSRINTSSNDSEGSNVGAFNGKDASLLLDDQTLDKTHRLAALQVPGRGSEQREALSRELAELVKLVNAVREYDVSNPQEMENAGDVSSMIPDGRIYPLPARLDLSSHASYGETSEEGPMVVKGETDQGTRGRVLLKHSQTATDIMYILPRKKVE